MKNTLLALLAIVLTAGPGIGSARAAERRPLALEDLFALRRVGDPQIAPDGTWVAYTVGRLDAERDEGDSDIWMTGWDGARTLRLTSSPEKEHTPRFSPEGRYLAFLSSRSYDAETDQLWVMERAGGEAERLTDLEGGITDFVWSPDGRRLVLVADDPDPDKTETGDRRKRDGKDGKKEKKPKPIVIDRLQFKQDKVGYLRSQRSHLYLFDLAARKAEILTPGNFNEYLPAWSPDGRSIVFVTKRGEDFDRHSNWDLYVIEARAGARARRLTTNDGPDCDPDYETRPAWSPDGESIAYLRGGPQELIWYAIQQIAVIPAAGGTPRLPTRGLDRNTTAPRWAPDGASLYFLLEDDGNMQLARVPASGGAIERLTPAGQVVDGFDVGKDGRVAVLAATPDAPPEVSVLEDGAPRPLSRRNDAWLSHIRLGTTEEIAFASDDGTEIHGFVVKPPGFRRKMKSPAVLRIHGGPVGQYDNRFRFDWQLLAAHGYVVIAANPRGSSGRGEEFQKAIFADWGNLDVQDVLAAVDHVVARGMADPDRLGIGGWSYGGMLTNYTIARDSRFKAATSGASISNILAGYGTDHYIREYELELGRPWEALDVWLRNSYPFLHADRIVTPTLFLCGQKDVNVPLLASEQMYQALRSLGVDTRLIIYPGQYHGIRRPSFQLDRLRRYLDWYDRYLKPAGAAGERDTRAGG